MKIESSDTVLLTGASGGLGQFMARAFADYKVKQALVAYPGTSLEGLRKEIERRGGKAIAIMCDLRDATQRRQLLQDVKKELGPIDILINNAGVEFTSAYHDLDEENIREELNVNLEAPMILSRLVLPEMLERKRGHIVNISSLAGKAGPAFQEPYAASK
ncbi:MAG TPA: SDR family NAD(P)-dependent oxidoreductase, partial [Candidatus Saccharimonadales bacterium]|nr:SDR family NAD(P)-dependent oxidoreductase [Candidatus Saccharimonadales bacterium]